MAITTPGSCPIAAATRLLSSACNVTVQAAGRQAGLFGQLRIIERVVEGVQQPTTDIAVPAKNSRPVRKPASAVVIQIARHQHINAADFTEARRSGQLVAHRCSPGRMQPAGGPANVPSSQAIFGWPP